MTEIYLDYNASAPMDKRVIESMLPFLENHFGNASSSHGFGHRLSSCVEDSREQIASFVGGSPGGVIFTAGATEANNQALRGLFHRNGIGSGDLMISAVEHASVRNTAQWLNEQQGVRLKTVPVTAGGFVDIAALRELLNGVKLVSVMGVNSETGIINPLGEVVELAREHGALVHCDATQMVGREPFDMTELGIDLVSFSGHKIYGPAGVGALIVSREVRKLLEPILFGGGHENGLRSGSLNVAGIVGLGVASRLAEKERHADSSRLSYLRDQLVSDLQKLLPEVQELGDTSKRVANTTNIRFLGADADAVMANMRDVAVSNGSACSSGAIEPSIVLQEMGLDRTAASEALRFSLGRFTTSDDIDTAIPRIVTAVQYVRTMTEVEE